MHPNSLNLLDLRYPRLNPTVPPTKENFKKIKPKQSKQTKQNQEQQQNQTNQTKKTPSLFLLLFYLSNASSLVPVALGSVVCHKDTLLSSQLCWQVFTALSDRSGSRVSSFWYTVITGSSLELFWDILWLPRVTEILWVLFLKISPFKSSSMS